MQNRENCYIVQMAMIKEGKSITEAFLKGLKLVFP